MNFFTEVQKGRISAPVYKSYSDVTWEAAYTEMRDSVECDRIFNAGKIIFRLLDSLRSVNSSIPKWCTTEKHIQYLIGLSNRDSIVLSQMIRDGFHQTSAKVMNDLEHFKVPLGNGQMAKPDEIGTSSVDSLTTVIPDVRSTSGISIIDGLSNLEKLHCLTIQLNLCNVYQWIESIWRDCLWNGYEFIDDGAFGYYIQPSPGTAQAIAMATAASLHRRKMFQINRIGLLAEIWRTRFSDAMKASSCSMEFVTAIVGSGKAKCIRLSSGKYDESEDRARFEAFSTKDLIQHEFYREILSTPVPKLGGESVATLFDLIMFLHQPFPAPTVSGMASSVPARPPVAAPWQPCRRGG